MDLIEKSIEDVKDGKSTLVILNNLCDKVIFSSNEAGIKSLFKFVSDNKKELENSYVIDKVVGSAAAFLMSFAKVESCYGITMSEGACDIFEGNEIKYSYITEVKKIMKNETTMCMMESLVKDLKTNEDAYNTLYDFFKDKI